MNLVSLITFTLLFSAFFSGMKIAFISANKLKVELDKNKGMLSARILSGFMQRPSQFIGTMLLGNYIALVIYSIAMATLLDSFLIRSLPHFLQTGAMLLLLQILISTFIILILAEFLPRILFRIYSNRLLNIFIFPAYLMYILLYPLIYLFTGASELIMGKLMGIKSGTYTYQFSASPS